MPFLPGRLHIGPINLTVCSCLIYLHLLGQLVSFKHRMRKVYGNLVNIIGLKKYYRIRYQRVWADSWQPKGETQCQHGNTDPEKFLQPYL